VATPLGSGYGTEEQITNVAEYGGIQIIVYPMKKDTFENLFPVKNRTELYETKGISFMLADNEITVVAGGHIKETIYDDPYGFDVWETNVKSRCFVHLTNSLNWKDITNDFPPTKPVSAKEYSKEGLPWFEDYKDDVKGLRGAQILKGLKTIFKKNKESVCPVNIREIGGKTDSRKLKEE